MKIHCLGHASFLIESGGKNIYIDPYNLKTGKPGDLVLVTHDHYDHCDPRSIAVVAEKKANILGPEDVQRKLPDAGILRPGDKLDFEGVKIKAVHAYNTESPYHMKGRGLGFLIESEGKRVYHAGDTDLISEMEDLGKIDVALLPVGGRYTMDAKAASLAVKKIKPEIAVPMHYGGAGGSWSEADRFKKLAEKETKSKIEILEKRPLEI